MGRMSKDGAITILQGRAVGGTTLINWTSSFRTPPQTLEHWARNTASRPQREMRPGSSAWSSAWASRPGPAAQRQQRRAAPWLRTARLPLGVIPRNVRGCWNLGYCGMGCPVNAKQSMLVTPFPPPWKRRRAAVPGPGRALHAQRRAHPEPECQALDAQGVRPPAQVSVRARHYVLAGGGINSPALLLRSDAPDPHGRLGKRTFLHLVNFSAARFDEVSTLLRRAAVDLQRPFPVAGRHHGPVGYKLEVPPLHPALASTLLGGTARERPAHGRAAAHPCDAGAAARRLSPRQPGGAVELRGDGSPVLDYPVTDYLGRLAPRLSQHGRDPVRRRRQAVMPCTAMPALRETWPGRHDRRLSLELFRTRLGSAHVMGGCAMGEDPRQAVCDSLGRHHQLENLSIHDGSLFPTSIGANPQLSVYAISANWRSLVALANA
jgi:choline dehydrogenase-like flavoprotein